MLLSFKSVNINRDLRRGCLIFQKDKLPSLCLSTVTQVEVFCEGVALPSSSIFDTRYTPDACCTVEIQKTAYTAANMLFYGKMGVEPKGMDASQ